MSQSTSSIDLSLKANVCDNVQFTSDNISMEVSWENMVALEESMDKIMNKVDKNSDENESNLQLEPKNNPLNVGENWRGKITPEKKKTFKLYGIFSRLGLCTIA